MWITFLEYHKKNDGMQSHILAKNHGMHSMIDEFKIFFIMNFNKRYRYGS
jgi:hypothetical protein